MVAASTLTAWRVGGQVDPSWLFDVGETSPWAQLRAVATIGPTPTTGHILDPSNGARLSPLSNGNIVATADEGGLWWTDTLKATTAADAADHLAPAGLGWSICLDALHTNGQWAPVAEWTIAISADRDYTAEGETFTTDGGLVVVDIDHLAAPPTLVGGGGSGTGGDEQVFTETAVTTISAGQVVALTGGGVEPFDPTDLAGPDVYGVARTAAAAGGQVEIVTDGRLELTGASLTTGATYYADTDGSLTATAPTSGLLVAVGYAADADTFVVQIGDPIQLA